MMVFIHLNIFIKAQVHKNDRDSKRFSQKEVILTDKKDLKRFS